MADAICNGPPPSFVREDLGAAITFARYLPKLKAIPGGPQKLSEPFSKFLEDAGVKTSGHVRSPKQKKWANMGVSWVSPFLPAFLCLEDDTG